MKVSHCNVCGDIIKKPEYAPRRDFVIKSSENDETKAVMRIELTINHISINRAKGYWLSLPEFQAEIDEDYELCEKCWRQVIDLINFEDNTT